VTEVVDSTKGVVGVDSEQAFGLVWARAVGECLRPLISLVAAVSGEHEDYLRDRGRWRTVADTPRFQTLREDVTNLEAETERLRDRLATVESHVGSNADATATTTDD